MNAPALKFDFSQATTAPDLGPQIFVLHSKAKWGKTTLACQIPNSWIIVPEDGLKGISRPTMHFPRSPRNLVELYEAVDAFERGNVKDHNGQRSYRHLVIDNLSWIEMMINQASRADVKSRNLGTEFQSGHKIADARWDEFVERVVSLRKRSGIHIWLLAHADKTKDSDIEGGQWDKWDLQLEKKAAALIKRTADHVFYGAYRSELVKGKNGRRSIGRYTGRVLYTRDCPDHFAGSRSGVPEVVNATWPDLVIALKAGTPAPSAKLRADVEAIAASLPEEHRLLIVADLAVAKTDADLQQVLSRAEGFAALAEPEVPEEDQAGDAGSEETGAAPKTPDARVRTVAPAAAAKPASAAVRVPQPARQQDDDDEEGGPAPLDGDSPKIVPPSAPPARGSDPGSARQPSADPEATAAALVDAAGDLEGISKGLAAIHKLPGLSDEARARHMQALKDKRAGLLARNAR